MAEPKTRPTAASVDAFIKAIPDEVRRADCQAVRELMEKATGSKAVMWGDAIVGFGSHLITYSNGKSLDWPLVGFSPRKGPLVLYIMDGFASYDELLGELGKHKTGKSCLYINKLADVDAKVLNKLVKASVAHQKKR